MIVPTPFRRLAGVVLGAATLLLPASLAAQGAAPTTRRFPPICRRRMNCRALSRVGQLSRRAPRRHPARRRRRRGLLPRRAARRSEEPRAAGARLPLGAGRRRRRGGGPARRARRQARQERPHRPARARRSRAQAEEIRGRAAEPRRSPCADRSPISPPRCSAPGRATARTTPRPPIEAIDKLQGADWYALFKDLHAGLILDLAGNKKEAGKRFDRAHKLDATALRVVEAYGSWLSRNGKQGRGAEGVQGLRRAAAAPSADRRRDGDAREGQAAAAAGRRRAGRRRRSALRPRRRARPPRRRGPRPRLSAARALSRAQPAAGAAVARRSLRADEESAACDQDLRARAAEFAAAAQRRDPARGQSRHASTRPTKPSSVCRS